nr:VOC family protein [Secundilactobacillus kimchicus]
MQTHHISLLTKDANQNIRFYTHILGLRLVKNTVNQENIHIRHLFYGDNLGTPGSVVTFFCPTTAGPPNGWQPLYQRYPTRNPPGE